MFAAEKGFGKIGLGWMSTAYSVGSFMYQTDYMQSKLARGFANEYKRYEFLYRLEKKKKNRTKRR